MPSDSDSSLPSFDSKKVYVLSGDTLEKLIAKIHADEPKIVTGGGLVIAQKTKDGTFLKAAETLDLQVCVNINGVTQGKTITFLVAKGPH